MSNCIEIQNPSVCFSAMEIDLEAFRARCGRLVNYDPWRPNQEVLGEEDPTVEPGPTVRLVSVEDQNFAWFLASNS